FLRNLLTDALLLLPEFGCEFGAEVFGFEYRPEFDFDSSAKWGTLYPLDRFVHGAHLPQPESGNQFLRLGERAVDDGALRAGKFDALAFRGRRQTFTGEHHSGFH